MEEVGFEALAVLRAELMPRALRRANDQRHLGLAAVHVANFRRVIDDLIDRKEAEVHRHQLDYRPQPAHRSANAGADNG